MEREKIMSIYGSLFYLKSLSLTFLVLVSLVMFPGAVSGKTREYKINPKNVINPVSIEGTSQELNWDASKLGARRCHGYVSENPALLVDIPKGTSDFRFTLIGLEHLLILAENGSYWCISARDSQGLPSLAPQDWPGGKARIFVGLQFWKSNVTNREYKLVIENVSRPRNLGWSDVPVTTLDADSEKPLVLASTINAFRDDYGFRLHKCNTKTESLPSHIIHLNQPVGDLSLMFMATDNMTGAVLVGPLTDDLRNLESRCLNRGLNRLSDRSKPGRYALFGTHLESKLGTSYSLVISHSKTKRDPLFFSHVAGTLTVTEKFIDFFMPFWTQAEDRSLVAFSPRAQEIFSKAPKGLFVFAMHDLDERVLQMGELRKGVKPEFPKKGEPLLIYQFVTTRVLAADGSIYYPVNPRDIPANFSSNPPDSISIPKEARNIEYKFSSDHTPTDSTVMLNRTPPDKGDPEHAPYMAYFRVVKEHDTCVKRVWKPVERTVAALRNTRMRTAAEERQLLSLEEKYGRMEERQCKPQKLDKARKDYFDAMVKVNKARRDKVLQEISERLQVLFGKQE